MAYSSKWSLEEFFKGGSTSSKFKQELQALQKELQKPLTINSWQTLTSRLRQVASFVSCLTAQDVHDSQARVLQAEVTAIEAVHQKACDQFFEKLAHLSDVEFQNLVNKEQPGVIYQLQKRRQLIREKLKLQEEKLATDLAIDGYHGWNEMYRDLIGKMQIPFRGKLYSAASAENMLADKSRAVRKEIFTNWNTVCKTQESLFSQTLNHLVGFRGELYRHRKWKSPLKEPLFFNNISEISLESMWEVVNDNKKMFAAFLQKKAKALKLKKLSWYDLEAPFGSIDKKISYARGSEIIIRAFSRYSASMAAFAKKALESHWVDAEDRSGKAPGGFCTVFPESDETRIFMNYSGTFQNLLTLAHELGHAYHSHVLFHLPQCVQDYPMTLAETASTLAEQLVLDDLLQNADKKEQELIFQSRAQRSSTFFLNIHARFLFEKSFAKMRENGFISSKAICELMEKAQKEAYANCLETYHPYFWITKQHFHFSDLSFYNFPYTVGYLLSLAIMKKARKDQKGFAKWYIAFLQDTGAMSLEDIIRKHFKLDPQKTTFWQEAIDVAKEDLREFLD